MAPRSPEDMHGEFTRAFNAGDVEALLTRYEPEAIMTPEPGTTVAGTDAIREVLNGFLALKGKVELSLTATSIRGSCHSPAILHGRWGGARQHEAAHHLAWPTTPDSGLRAPGYELLNFL